MTIGPEMRQRLLELIHDLLSEDEEAELRERIDRDPQLARAYEEVRATADAMSEAARVEAPPIELRRPEDRDPAIGASLPSGTGKRRVSEAPPPARAARWTVGITAAVLLLVSLGGYLSHRSRMSTIAAAHPRLLVTGPSHIGVETDSRFSITTSGATGEPMAAEIEFLLQGPGDRQIFAHHESTDEEGRLDVVVPAADVREASSGSPAGASLTVLAVSGDRRAQCEGLLRLEPLGYQTDLSPGKSSYRPGDEVTYQSSTVSRLTLTASRAFPVTFTIIDPQGNDVSRQQTTTEVGVARGKTRLRDDAPAGRYRLSLTSADVALPQRSCIFWVRDALDGEAGADVEFRRERFRPGQEVTADFSLGPVDGIPAAGVAVRTTVRLAGEVVDEQTAETSADGTLRIAFTLPKEIHRAGATLAITFDRQGTSRTLVREIPLDLGHLQVSFYPEGGQLAAGLENRVYFMARDGHGEPVDLKGVIVDAQGRPVTARCETVRDGRGVFTFAPQAGEQYRMQIVEPADELIEPALPEALSSRKIVLTAGAAVFAAGEPLQFNVRAAHAGIPLVVAATCRGASAGHQMIVTSVDETGTGAHPITFPLDDRISGVIRLTVFDYGKSPPVAVAQRLVYRHSGQESSVPPIRFLQCEALENTGDAAQLQGYLGGDSEADAALDLLLGTQGWRRLVAGAFDDLLRRESDGTAADRSMLAAGLYRPPVVFDNLGSIRSRYDDSLQNNGAYRSGFLDAITTLSSVASLGLLMFVGLLVLMNVVSGPWIWAPTACSAVLCPIIGVVQMVPPDADDPAGKMAVFETFHARPAGSATAADRQREVGAALDDLARSAPASGSYDPSLRGEVIKILADPGYRPAWVPPAPVLEAESPGDATPPDGPWTEYLDGSGASGVIEAGDGAGVELVVDVPSDPREGSVNVAIRGLPSWSTELQLARKNLPASMPGGAMHTPSGPILVSALCDVLLWKHMQDHGMVDPALTREMKCSLREACRQLAELECSDGGFSVLKKAPGEVVRTASILMLLRKMAEVVDVEPRVIFRTGKWLLDQKDDAGAFSPAGPLGILSLAWSVQTVDPYVVWAMSESGTAGLEAELDRIETLAASAEDPLIVALAATALINGGRKSQARPLLEKLADLQTDDGSLPPGGMPKRAMAPIIPDDDGPAIVQTTAVAALGWLKSGNFTSQAERAIDWLLKHRQPGGLFGPPRTTALALLALAQRYADEPPVPVDGTLVIRYQGKVIAQQTITPAHRGPVVLDGLEAHLRPGINRLTLELTGTGTLPYVLEIGRRTD